MKVTGFKWRKKHPRWLCGFRGIYRGMGGTRRTRQCYFGVATKVYCGSHYWLGETVWMDSP